MKKETVELIPQNNDKEKTTEKPVEQKVVDQMQELVRKDIKYENQFILANTKQLNEIGYATTKNGEMYFCDAEIIETPRTIPTPVVIPKKTVIYLIRQKVF